jgi:hypothetical protein
MFIRKKKNRSGTVSVVVVSKQSGVYREIHSVGTAHDASGLEDLVSQGREWIRRRQALPDLFDKKEREEAEREKIEYFFSNIENILLNGARLILSRVYGMVGFDVLNDTVLKELVIARICRPVSKSATAEYLKGYFDEDVDLSKIYRYNGCTAVVRSIKGSEDKR